MQTVEGRKECLCESIVTLRCDGIIDKLVVYEQVDGVAMGSPFGPLMANTFTCSLVLQEKLVERNQIIPPVFR